MKLVTLIRQLKEMGNDDTEICIEAIDDEGEIYYEDNFSFFKDSNGEIGLSPNNK